MTRDAGGPELRAELARKAARRRAGPDPTPAAGRPRSLFLLLGAAGLAGGTLVLSRGGTEAGLLCSGLGAVLLIGGFPRNRSDSARRCR